MKKAVSIFLLSIMLLISAHPVLALHYCGGKLNSFSVLNSEVPKSCCADMAMPQQKSTESQKGEKGTSPLYATTHQTCCDFKNIELSTDDYQNQTQQINLKSNVLPSFESIWFVLPQLLLLDADSAVADNYYTVPDNVHLQNIDLLSYICIYRI